MQSIKFLNKFSLYELWIIVTNFVKLNFILLWQFNTFSNSVSYKSTEMLENTKNVPILLHILFKFFVRKVLRRDKWYRKCLLITFSILLSLSLLKTVKEKLFDILLFIYQYFLYSLLWLNWIKKMICHARIKTLQNVFYFEKISNEIFSFELDGIYFFM